MSREALWQAILENPEDRTVRLIYADWLEEYSNNPEDLARAEFIRLQIMLENRPRGSRKRSAERKRSREILTQYKAIWTADLRDVEAMSFRGGFLEHVALFATDFVQRGTTLLAAYPTITSVHLRDARQTIGKLLASGLLPRLRRVDLSSMCTYGCWAIQDELTMLARSEQLSGIRHLSLSANRLSEATLTAFAESPYLGSLRSLDLSKNHLSGPDHLHPILRLLQAPWLGQLEELNLTGMPLSSNLRQEIERRIAGRLLADPPPTESAK
jgi:uncharacterized protein (TIGR02996 family)